MEVALYVTAYIAVGVFSAALFRKGFNHDYADFLIELLIALTWPVSAAGMCGALLGRWLGKRK